MLREMLLVTQLSSGDIADALSHSNKPSGGGVASQASGGEQRAGSGGAERVGSSSRWANKPPAMLRSDTTHANASALSG